MKRFKQYLLVAVGFALAGMLGASFGTGAAQAFVATLVQIVNTAANPVPTQDVDNRARQPVSFTARIPVLANAQNGFSYAVYQVPAGKRLVIEYINADGNVVPPEQVFWVTITNGGGTSSDPEIEVPAINLPPYVNVPTFHPVIASQKVFMYANPGDQINFEVTTDGGVNGVPGLNIHVNGYLVDLP